MLSDQAFQFLPDHSDPVFHQRKSDAQNPGDLPLFFPLKKVQDRNLLEFRRETLKSGI